MPARTAAPPASQDREVLRLGAPVVLWWVWIVFVAVNVGDFAIQGLSSARFGAVVSAVLLFVTGLVYVLALRPRVITDGAGVTVLNPFRTNHVPWRLIRSVDTGEWVRIRYAAPASAAQASAAQASVAQANMAQESVAPDDTAPQGAVPDGAVPDGAVPGGTAPDGATPGDDAQTKTLYCWALYVSARAKRKIARGTPRPRRGLFQVGGFGRARAEIEASGYATPANSKLPEEARYLASLPVAQAMASRLDTRAARERARKPRLSQAAAQVPDQASASWAWPAIAVVVIPAIILLIVALV
jgi:hypothetical protein